MENPFVYLTLNTMRNQLRVRLRRLRQPRYAIGLILGVGYFALILGRPFFFGVRNRAPGVEEVATNGRAIAHAIGSAVLFVLFALPCIFRSRQKPALAV
jgi:hypothetical protein